MVLLQWACGRVPGTKRLAIFHLSFVLSLRLVCGDGREALEPWLSLVVVLGGRAVWWVLEGRICVLCFYDMRAMAVALCVGGGVRCVDGVGGKRRTSFHRFIGDCSGSLFCCTRYFMQAGRATRRMIDSIFLSM